MESLKTHPYYLLLFYTVRVGFQLVVLGIFDNSDIDATVGTSQVLSYSVCTALYSAIGPYTDYLETLLVLFDALLLTLAFVPLLKQSIAMYKVTGRRWEPNRYMSMIVKEGLAYFFMNLLSMVVVVVNGDPLLPIWFLIGASLQTIIMYPTIPRFVISMRELFDKDSRGRLEGIDSAFGISSRSGNVSGRDHSITEIVFVDGTSHPDEEGGETIHVEVRGNDT